MEGKRVAVVGSGITGLSSAWLLHRNGARVTLFEKEATCGGHTLTDDSSGYPVDLGFQVYNLTTYPHLVGFLECLGVDTEPSDMSFALSMDGGRLEWGSDNLDTIFAQRSNLLSPAHWGMVRDVVRFGKEAPKVLEPAQNHVYRDMTLGQYLQRERYTKAFTTNYVVPMCAAVWSVPNAQVLGFPVQMLVRFWVNHHLLDIFQRPLWRVVKDRSRSYVKAVCAELPDVRTSCGVTSVQRSTTSTTTTTAAAAGGPSTAAAAVALTTEAGETLQFDAVVFATHSDVTLRILGQDATPAEREVLEAIPYNENDIYLHSDPSLMPASRKVWASWNFLGSSGPQGDAAPCCVSYWVNRLQRLPAGAPELFVTLNPPHPPAEHHIKRRLKLSHPVFSFKSWEAQARVAGLQGQRATFFAGAWCGYGFHEDGIRAAVAAVQAMGIKSLPWEPRSTSPKVTMVQGWFLGLFERFARQVVKVGHLRVILPTGQELSFGDPAYVHAVPDGEAWKGRPAPRATLRVFDMDFFRKVVVRHDTGLGEAYMDKDYEVDDLGGFMSVVVTNAYGTEEARGSLGVLNWLGDRLLHLAHLARPNTIEGSRKNIEDHYDAGNAMYKVFLDDSMMYSCAMHQPGEELYQAQMRKLDAIIDAAGIQPADHVLEIGCGWGAFAIRAAQRTGCRVTGLTLSKEQLAEATARVKELGLSDKVTLLFCDYRDYKGDGSHDVVVSIEMIEAVGHENLPSYFSTISRVLKPGGRAVIQAICCPDERYDAYRRCSDFIREHIFPGGHMPCIGACVEAARGSGLSLRDTVDIGPEYAITLREWRRRWEQRRADVLKLGYSERFWRKYRFYFAYCEAGFDGRYIHDFHLTWVKEQANQAPSINGLPNGNGAPATAAVAANGALMGRSAGAGGAGGSSSVASSVLSASAAVLQRELPSDPANQALLALYFFLVGMMVRGHRDMWILPTVSCACALAHLLVHKASHLLVPAYPTMGGVRQAWWCADVLHLGYSCAVAVASLGYLHREPRALQLHAQPEDTAQASAIVASATGFFAFYLWLTVRSRLFQDAAHAIVQYTLLLLLFGVAVYKGVNVPFLAATLVSEVSSVFLLAGKLLHLAGGSPTSSAARWLHVLEGGSLLLCRALPHLVVTCIVLCTPSAFASTWHLLGALLGLVYMNVINARKARTALAGLMAPQGGAAAGQHLKHE